MKSSITYPLKAIYGKVIEDAEMRRPGLLPSEAIAPKRCASAARITCTIWHKGRTANPRAPAAPG
jgi:hypothetical protein